MAVEHRGGLRSAAMVLAVCRVLLLDPAPTTAQTTECLSPAAEQKIKELFAAGTLQTTLGRDLALTGVNLTGTKIEVRAQNASGQQYGIDLTLPGASDRPPDRRGERFVFHVLAPAASDRPDAVKALLATADLIDRAVPEDAFADCSGRPSPPPGQAVRYPHHYPRAWALSSAMVQVLILFLATLFGWRVVRSM